MTDTPTMTARTAKTASTGSITKRMMVLKNVMNAASTVGTRYWETSVARLSIPIDREARSADIQERKKGGGRSSRRSNTAACSPNEPLDTSRRPERDCTRVRPPIATAVPTRTATSHSSLERSPEGTTVSKMALATMVGSSDSRPTSIPVISSRRRSTPISRRTKRSTPRPRTSSRGNGR